MARRVRRLAFIRFQPLEIGVEAQRCRPDDLAFDAWLFAYFVGCASVGVELFAMLPFGMIHRLISRGLTSRIWAPL